MIPEEGDDDPNFRLKEPKSSEKLLETWKKGQKHLEHFWKIWKDDYQERSQIYNRSHGLEIAQIQQNTPKRSWKIGRIMKLIKSRDREERAAKVLLQSRNTLQRSLYQLFPLECDERIDSDKNMQRERTPIDKSNLEGKRQNRKQSRNQTANEARDKIYGQYLED